jgi:cobalt-zinc-cadmium efflux system outer membrane protein
MTASRTLTFRAAIGLAAALGCCWALASDPLPSPQEIAKDTPTFRAPAEPPGKEAPEETPAPEPVGPLALRDALALALMRNPELAVFSWETRASEARALQAKKVPNPELDVRVYRLGIPRGSIEPDDKRTRVVLSQVLELGSKRKRRFNLARTEHSLAEWDYEAKRVEVAAVVAARFVAVLGAQRRVESQRRFVEYFEAMYERVKGLVEVGSMRSVEIHQTQRQVGLARIDLRRAEAELSAARLRMAAAWGSQSPRFEEAVGDLEDVATYPDIDTVIQLARQGPAIARWDAELARSEAALAVAKSGRVPDIRAGAGVRWQEHTEDEDYLIDLEIDLPLFDRKQGDIREARYGMSRAEAGRRAAEAETADAIAEFYYLLVEADARRSTLHDDVLPAARATFEAHRLGFDSQAENLGDLLDARRDLARAEVDYTDALVDYHQAFVTLEGIVGQGLTPSE